ncbi:OpgC domain-containing protein [Novosphingobium panipatense]|uniref:OpgC domain-containing protein n=1 Tax=Novosphingobium panipatense TaxID=428991 RepID=UPI00360A9EC3
MPPGGKIPGLDIARTVAIVLAMLNHSFIATNVWRDFFEGKPHVTFAVRLATPMFIILFGALLEIVYRRRAVRDGMQAVTARLFERGLLCWLLYTLTLLPLLLLGKTSVKSALFGALLLGKIPLTDILRYYAILFFMAPLLLVVRQRWGLYPLLATTTLLLLAHPFCASSGAGPRVRSLRSGADGRPDPGHWGRRHRSFRAAQPVLRRLGNADRAHSERRAFR